MIRARLNLKLAGFVVLGILMSAPAGAGAQEFLPLSLGEVIRMAGERNVQIIVADQRVRQALDRMDEEAAVFAPQLSGSVIQKRQTRDIRASGLSLSSSSEVVGPSNIFDARVTLTQTILDPVAVERLKAARVGTNWSDAHSRKVRQHVFALAAALFVRARSASQEEKFGQVMAERDRQYMEVARGKKEMGTGSSIAWKRAKADYRESIYQYRMAAANAEERRLDLLAALGLPSGQEVIFASEDDLAGERIPALGPDPARIENLIKGHPDMESALKEADLRRAEYDAQKAGYWPKVSAFADYGPGGVTPGDANNTYAFGVQASVPVWEGGARQAKIREAQSKLTESEAVAADTRLRVEAEVRSSLEAVRGASALVEAKDAAVEVAEDHLKQTQRRADNGSASELELIDAAAGKRSAVYERQAAWASYVIARVNLARALGDVESVVQRKDGSLP